MGWLAWVGTPYAGTRLRLKGLGDQWDQPYWPGSGQDAQAGVAGSWGGPTLDGCLTLSRGAHAPGPGPGPPSSRAPAADAADAAATASTSGALLRAVAPLNASSRATYRFDLLPSPSKRLVR